MSGWNGSGVFTFPYNWEQDAANGINIRADRMDSQFFIISTNGFANTLTRDGQGFATANLPMNGFHFTGLGNGSLSGDSAALGQVFQISNNLSEGVAGTMRTNLGLGTSATVNTGTSGATIPLLNAANTWSANQTLSVLGNIGLTVQTTSSAGAAQLVTADNGSGTIGIISYGTGHTGTTMGISNASLSNILTNSAALVIGTAAGGGNFTLGTNNTAQLLLTSGGGVSTSGVSGGDKGAGTINAGTLYQSGTALGTAALQNTGTSGANIPFLNGTNTWANAQTFMTAPVFSDQSGSRTALGLGTAATQSTGTFFQVSNNLSEGTLGTKQTNLGIAVDTSHTGLATTAGGSGSFSTSVSSIGRLVPLLVCTTNNAGWVAGDTVMAPATNDTTTNRGVIVGWNGTTVYWAIGSGGISIIPKAGGSAAAITAADWTLTVLVYQQ